MCTTCVTSNVRIALGDRTQLRIVPESVDISIKMGVIGCRYKVEGEKLCSAHLTLANVVQVVGITYEMISAITQEAVKPLVEADLQELRKELTNKTLPVAFTRQCPRCREKIDLRECGVDKPVNRVRDKPKRNACPHCKADFCQTCGGVWHEGKTCRDAARDVGDLSDRLIDAQCKRCPNETCAVKLTHDHGKIAPLVLLYIYNISHTPPRSSPNNNNHGQFRQALLTTLAPFPILFSPPPLPVLYLAPTLQTRSRLSRKEMARL
jgi:hypothetical protein